MSRELVTVRLVHAPVAAWDEADIYYADLMREFQLILLASRARGGRDQAPRLIAVMEELTARYAVAATAPRPERDAASASGADHVDVTFRVPRGAGAEMAELGRLLVEADDLCRSPQLLSLTASHETRTFSRWYVEEFVRQTAGEEPTPWAAP